VSGCGVWRWCYLHLLGQVTTQDVHICERGAGGGHPGELLLGPQHPAGAVPPQPAHTEERETHTLSLTTSLLCCCCCYYILFRVQDATWHDEPALSLLLCMMHFFCTFTLLCVWVSEWEWERESESQVKVSVYACARLCLCAHVCVRVPDTLA